MVPGDIRRRDWLFKGVFMTDNLCEEEECDIDQCPDEPCHCEYGLEVLMAKAELRADLAKDPL
jgi:hypothetical protein